MALMTEETGVAVPVNKPLTLDQVAAILGMPLVGVRNLIMRGLLRHEAGGVMRDSVAAYQQDEPHRRAALDRLLSDTEAYGQ